MVVGSSNKEHQRDGVGHRAFMLDVFGEEPQDPATEKINASIRGRKVTWRGSDTGLRSGDDMRAVISNLQIISKLPLDGIPK